MLLDVTDTQHVVALNPLDASMGFTRDQAIANLMSSFERIWKDFWGPKMAYFLHMAARSKQSQDAMTARCSVRYVVLAGETLSSIASSYGLDWTSLASFNHLSNPSLLIVGQSVGIVRVLT